MGIYLLYTYPLSISCAHNVYTDLNTFRIIVLIVYFCIGLQREFKSKLTRKQYKKYTFHFVIRECQSDDYNRLNY